MAVGYVYNMTNATSGTLYVGVTANLAARIHQHRSGDGSDFCRRYGLTWLVYVEEHDRSDEAIVREKAIKAWRRSWKLNLIGKTTQTGLTFTSQSTPDRRAMDASLRWHDVI